ncbi:MAG: hypothetical protein R6U56_09570 [Opitutales bacterium]
MLLAQAGKLVVLLEFDEEIRKSPALFPFLQLFLHRQIAETGALPGILGGRSGSGKHEEEEQRRSETRALAS